MPLINLQQQVNEWVEVYYECLLKLANYLQVKTINVFFTTIFKATIPYISNIRYGKRCFYQA